MSIQNAHGSTLTSPLPDPKGNVRYYHHIASSVVCKSLTLTLEGCRRGVYPVPSWPMGTLGCCPGAHKHRGPMLIYAYFVLYVFLMFKNWLCWKYQYNIYMVNFIYIFSFTSSCECLCRYGPQCTALPGCLWCCSIVTIQKAVERVYTCTMLR